MTHFEAAAVQVYYLWAARHSWDQ